MHLAEAEVAVGDQWTHAEFFGQGEGLTKVDLTAFGIKLIGMDRDVAEYAQRDGFFSALTSVPRQGQGPLADGRCLVEARREEAGLREQCVHGCLLHQEPPGLDLVRSR